MAAKLIVRSRRFSLGLVVRAFAVLATAIGCYPKPVEQEAAVVKKPIASLTDPGAILSPLPLYFVENNGNTDEPGSFTLSGRSPTVFFAPQGLTFVLNRPADAGSRRYTPGNLSASNGASAGLPPRWVVTLDFIGANANARPVGEEPLETLVSFFEGRPDSWRAGLRTFSRVVYYGLWPGIDLAYGLSGDRLKYEFVVAPGADLSLIRLTYRGASDIFLNAASQLEVITPLGGINDEAPVAYQDIEGKRVDVNAAYALDANLADIWPPADDSGTQPRGYGFRVGAYDRTRPLVLRPAMLP